MPKVEEISLTTFEKEWGQSSGTPPTTSPLSSSENSPNWLGKRTDDLPPWNPARKIITFMCIVCAVCTFIVVGIVIMALIVSKTLGRPGSNQVPSLQVLKVVPRPWNFANRSHGTIVIPTNNETIWKQHVFELKKLLQSYSQLQKTNSAPECSPHLHEQQTKNLTCLIPMEKIDQNCSISGNLGYDVASPCVALLFQVVRDWLPVPFDVNRPGDVPDKIVMEYDPSLVFLTCQSERFPKIRFRYSPFQGFPLNSFPRSMPTNSAPPVPPVVMVQVINPPVRTEVIITCLLWSKNLNHGESGSHGMSGKVTFSLLIL